MLQLLKYRLSKVYNFTLQPHGKIYIALMAPILSRSSDFTAALSTRQTGERQQALQEIAGIMEEIVKGITDIMVRTYDISQCCVYFKDISSWCKVLLHNFSPN